MAVTLNQNTDCCETTCTSATVNVAGPAGSDGAAGAAGTNGNNSYTTTSGTFVMPAVNATVTPVAVAASAWTSVGQVIFISTAGYLEVTAKPTSTSLTLKNLYASPTNAAEDVTIATSQTVSAAGLKGDAGGTGSAGTSLPVMAKGSLVTNNGSANLALAVGSGNTKFLGVDSGAATGLAWETVGYADLSGTLALNTVTTSGQLPIASIANAGGSAGDIAYWNGSAWVKLAKGTSGQLLEQGTSAPQWASSSSAVSIEAMGRVLFTHDPVAVGYDGDAVNSGSITVTGADGTGGSADIPLITIAFTAPLSSSKPVVMLTARSSNLVSTGLYTHTISSSQLKVKLPTVTADGEFDYAVFA
jgi:hypothetical protein